MMEAEYSNKIRKIWLHLTPEEYAKSDRKRKANTCLKLNDCVLKHLFDELIVTTFRNHSLNGFMEETLGLRNELNAIEHNLNQVVKKTTHLTSISRIQELDN
jgi:hypothetical protein